MITSMSFELLLFLFTALLSRAAPRVSNHALSDSEVPVSVAPGELDSTTIPNDLPEDTLRLSTHSTLVAGSTAITGLRRNKYNQLTTSPTKRLTSAATVSRSESVYKETSIKRNEDTPNKIPTTFTETTRSLMETSTSIISFPGDPETTTHSLLVKSTDPRPLVSSSDRRPTEILCNCSSEGTLDPDDCDRTTGQCVCMSGYTGILCEDCQDQHFSNDSTGCLPCGCDSYGALSLLCDSSGVCVCKTGVYGDKCDDCHPGFFHFSSTGCQPCQCNNHSGNCHPQSGICLSCQGNTKGPSCEECKYNFYRRPSTALSEVCVPCPCSSVTSSGSCHIDSGGRPVCDQCKPEYQGPHCDTCVDGFYNSDSICLPCNCSGNAAPETLPALCHLETGHCLGCVNHTAGRHCQLCAQGYEGDALAHSCILHAPTVTPTAEHPTTTTPQAMTLTSQSTTTTPSSGTTMTSESTLLLTTETSTLAPFTNTTTALQVVSWSQFNVIVLAVIIVVVVVLMGSVGGVYTYREYQNRKINAPFWTIELKEDNVSFCSYHDSLPNTDMSGLLEEEVSEAVSNGQLALSSPVNMYKA